MNINRGVALLIWSTHSHLYSALVEKKEKYLEKEEDQALISLLVLYFIFWGIYIEEYFAGFLPLGFSQDKSLCSFCMVVLFYLSVILFICFCYENEMKY